MASETEADADAEDEQKLLELTECGGSVHGGWGSSVLVGCRDATCMVCGASVWCKAAGMQRAQCVGLQCCERLQDVSKTLSSPACF